MQGPRSEAEANVTRLADGRIHTLIAGAGPSGLATAYRLAEGGIVSLVVEKNQAAGGLMRSIRRGGFTLDIGRKELYARILEVARNSARRLPRVPAPHRQPVSRQDSRAVEQVSGASPRSAAVLARVASISCAAGLARGCENPRTTRSTGIGGPDVALPASSRKGIGRSSEARPGPTCRHPTPRSTAATRVPIPSMRSSRD
jgi:NAD(P)-binding Rossmann-like domain